MVPRLSVKWYASSVPKSCNRTDENEDAFAPEISNGEILETDFFQCAVSDGATRSSFAGEFSRTLVGYCAGSRREEPFQNIIRESRSEWLGKIQALDLPWHAQEKVKEGAFATLLWLQFYPKGTNHVIWTNYWRVIAIGDTCLFQFRKDQPVLFLPIKQSKEFNNHPALISSNSRHVLFAEDWEQSGSWQEGDDFFLITDALAKWTLQALEIGKCPSTIFKDRLTRRSKENHFKTWIELLRKKREIRDDDTTLIWLKVM
jgi:hypothetical protein